MNSSNSNAVIIAGVVCLAAFGLAAILLVTPGPESQVRLGALFAVIGTGIAAFVAMGKADQAAGNTNGKLDARIEAGVHRAMSARRRGDEPATAAEIDELPQGMPR